MQIFFGYHRQRAPCQMNMIFMPEMDSEEVLKVELDMLRREHRELDAELAALSEGARGDTLMLSRLKRQKLLLKDRIARLTDRLTPDIIA